MGTVYIAKIGSLTKIGHTNRSVKARLQHHKQMHGIPVVLLCTFPGSRKSERTLHEKLDAFRVPSKTGYGFPEELFELPDAVLGFTLGALAHLAGASCDQAALLDVTSPYAAV